MYIGAENIISPLGDTAEENFEKLSHSITGIQLYRSFGFDKKDLYLSKLNEDKFNNFFKKFDALIIQSISNTLKKINSKNLTITDDNLIIIISSTKGNIDHLNENNNEFSLVESAKTIKNHFKLKNTPLIISNACISGVLAINTANNLISQGIYKHAIVVGADIISNFVTWGFQSLFAISDEICRPFDIKRKGITMGEGAGSVFITETENLYINVPLHLLAGVSTNDANHISGPSRTGEGLYRAIKKTQKIHQIETSKIDYISAHGTATNYNDEMESIAFSRLEMLNIPINSLKGFYGHTLGAAGLIETVIAMQTIKKGILIPSLGYKEQGTTHNMNIIRKKTSKKINCILKTASGFGGCNAALIIKK